MLDKIEILKRLRTKREEIKELFHADIIGIYGSYARGDQSVNSDVDIIYTVEKQKKFGLLEIEGLDNYLRDLFEVPAVDLINSQYINPVIELEIENELLYV